MEVKLQCTNFLAYKKIHTGQQKHWRKTFGEKGYVDSTHKHTYIIRTPWTEDTHKGTDIIGNIRSPAGITRRKIINILLSYIAEEQSLMIKGEKIKRDGENIFT